MVDIQVDTRVSEIGQLVSTMITSSESSLVVDPGYLPKEIGELAALAGSRGEVEAVALTHSHWEHIMGHSAFPDVPVWVSNLLAQNIERSEKGGIESLEQARKFDARRQVQRKGDYRWPALVHGMSDGEHMLIGDITVQSLLLPGHSQDSMGLLIPDCGLLVAGDYLSPLEIPIIENFQDYYRTVHRLISLLDSEVQEVIPGHGWKMSSKEARKIASDDLSYMYQMMFFRDSGDLQAMRYMLLPRMSDEPRIREQHEKNCRNLGVQFE